VVARHVEQGNVETADEIFEVVEGQVAASEHEIGSHVGQPVAVEAFVDLVRNREDARGLASENVQLRSLEAKRGPGVEC
jgi:hypothetical protein